MILGAFDPALAGIVSVTREDRTKRRHKASLHGMYVMPTYRGKGLGKELLHRVLALARAMVGLGEIQLVVASHNTQVVTLYERFGFELVWTERRALKMERRYVNVHHMALDLLKARGEVRATVGAV